MSTGRRRKVKAATKSNTLKSKTKTKTVSQTTRTQITRQGVPPRFVSEIRNIMTLLMKSKGSGPFKTTPNLPQYKTMFPTAVSLNAVQQKAFRNPCGYASFKAFDKDIKMLQRQEIRYDTRVSTSVSAQRKHRMEILRTYYDTLSRPFLTHGTNLSPNNPGGVAAPAVSPSRTSHTSPKPSSKKKVSLPPPSTRKVEKKQQVIDLSDEQSPPSQITSSSTSSSLTKRRKSTAQTTSRKRLHFDSPTEETKTQDVVGEPKKKKIRLMSNRETAPPPPSPTTRVSSSSFSSSISSSSFNKKTLMTSSSAFGSVETKTNAADDDDDDVVIMSSTVPSKRATSLDTFATPVARTGFSFGGETSWTNSSSVVSAFTPTTTSSSVTQSKKRDDTPRYGKKGGHSKLFGTEGRPPKSADLKKSRDEAEEKDDGTEFMRSMGTPDGSEESRQEEGRLSRSWRRNDSSFSSASFSSRSLAQRYDSFSARRHEDQDDDVQMDFSNTPTRTHADVLHLLQWKRFELTVEVLDKEKREWDKQVVYRDGFEMQAVVKKFFDIHPDVVMRVTLVRFLHNISYDDDDDAN